MLDSILVSPAVKVNSFADIFAESLFDDMVVAAESRYVANFDEGVPCLPWPEFFGVYVDVWSTANGIDLSVFPLPAEPVSIEPDYDDMAAWQTAVRTGISFS